ncbi:MAG: hypothetical protein ACK55I_12255, partial [bacterium]
FVYNVTSTNFIQLIDPSRNNFLKIFQVVSISLPTGPRRLLSDNQLFETIPFHCQKTHHSAKEGVFSNDHENKHHCYNHQCHCHDTGELLCEWFSASGSR